MPFDNHSTIFDLDAAVDNYKRQYGAKPNGFIIYRGPSVLDGEPIVVVAIPKSGNSKTDSMLQTFIMRSDVPPLEALKSGDDYSVCGDCLARPSNQGWCYVNVAQSVNMVYKSLTQAPIIRKGIDTGNTYKPYCDISDNWLAITALGTDKDNRLGTYGDPAAVPLDVWHYLNACAHGWNGYTHQWRTCSPAYAKYCMASIDKPCDTLTAEMMGYRCFIAHVEGEDKPTDTAHKVATCPADKQVHGEALASCKSCLGCGGTAGRGSTHRSITVHGTGYKVKRYLEWRAQQS